MKRYNKLDMCNYALHYNGYYTTFHDALWDVVYVHNDFGNLVLV